MVSTITRPFEPLDVVERHEREHIYERGERCVRERAKDREEMNKNE